MLHNEPNEVNFGDDPCGLEDLEIVTNFYPAIAVPFDAPSSVKHSAGAVSLAAHRGDRSIDRIRDRYEATWSEQERPRAPHQLEALQATAYVKHAVKKAACRMYAIASKPPILGTHAAVSALLRLVMTFRAAIFTARNGLHFETCCLGRTILEQMAWAAAVRSINDESLFKVSPATRVSSLKPLFPEVGRLYGKLSAVGHIEPQTIARYLDFSIPGAPGVVLATDRYMLEDAHTMLHLCDVYLVLSEWLLFEQILEPQHTYRALTGRVMPKEHREVLEYIAAYLLRNPNRGPF